MAAAVAVPVASVVAVAMVVPPAKVRLGPAVGAVKVTVVLGTGLLEASVTLAARGAAKSVPTVAVWLAPALTFRDEGAPGAFVNANVAATGTPALLADTA